MNQEKTWSAALQTLSTITKTVCKFVISLGWSTFVGRGVDCCALLLLLIVGNSLLYDKTQLVLHTLVFEMGGSKIILLFKITSKISINIFSKIGRQILQQVSQTITQRGLARHNSPTQQRNVWRQGGRFWVGPGKFAGRCSGQEVCFLRQYACVGRWHGGAHCNLFSLFLYLIDAVTQLTASEVFSQRPLVDYFQCDQIGRFITLWATFQSPWKQLFCPKCQQILSNFCKIFHFTSKILFGQLL